MANLTGKQDKFVAEYLSNGRNATAAYRVAYNCENMADATIWAHASRLLKHDKVKARIAEANSIAAENQDVTVESLTAMTRKAYEKAMQDDKGAAAMVSAIQLMGKLHGLITEKRENLNKNVQTADDVSDSELAAIAKRGSIIAATAEDGPEESDPIH